MNDIKNVLINSLEELGYQYFTKTKHLTFMANESIVKIFFHEDTVDVLVVYYSQLTESRTRNTVYKGLKSSQDMIDIANDTINGVELSNAVVYNPDEQLVDIVSYDTYRRYVAMKTLLPVAKMLQEQYI